MQDVIDFWFENLSDESDPQDPAFKATSARWFKKDPEFDQSIRSQFEDTLLACARRENDDWLRQIKGRMAQVLLFDQFTRNIYRDTPMAFALDRRARHITLIAMDDGRDQDLPLLQRAFLYMPLMHSEEIRHHRLAKDAYQGLIAEADARGLPGRSMFEQNLSYLQMHTDIVEAFGRYPHRNAILGRISSAEEAAFLKLPNSGF